MTTRTETVARVLAAELAESTFEALIEQSPLEAAEYGNCAYHVVKRYADARCSRATGVWLVSMVAEPIATHIAKQPFHTMRNGTRQMYMDAATKAIVALGGTFHLTEREPTEPAPLPPQHTLVAPASRFAWLAEQTGVSLDRFADKSRSPDTVAARAAVAYCLRVWVVGEMTLSYPHISFLMGRAKVRGHTHSTTITACRRALNRPDSADLITTLLDAIELTGLGRVDKAQVNHAGVDTAEYAK